MKNKDNSVKKTAEQRAAVSDDIKAARNKAAMVTELLKARYPDAVCSLEWHDSAWKLLVMGRLSAQCTDAKVNVVCCELFEKFPDAEAMANAEIEDIENIIRPCGLYHTKAANLKTASAIILANYNGTVPDTMEELLKLPGVGRKIANLILGDVYGKPGIVADTHCIRICGRLGFYPSENKDPYKTELIMSELIEPSEQSNFCHRLVLFGREVCRSQNPLCDKCPMKENGLCSFEYSR